eukprot:1118305-Pyramimonas_sp.AAC.1
MENAGNNLETLACAGLTRRMQDTNAMPDVHMRGIRGAAGVYTQRRMYASRDESCDSWEERGHVGCGRMDLGRTDG